jgi:uncharacterized protein YdcH (DUF465 family)
MYDPKTVKLTEPIKSIVEWVEELEKKHNLLDKRVIHFEQLASEIIGKLKKAGIELKDVTRV